ncbi:MAG: recombination-associated protein RdgC [Myxococcaceae bacterium]
MPILKGSVTFARFRVEPADKAHADLRRRLLPGLKSNAFEPIDRRGDDDRTAGFAELENPDSVEFGTSNVFYGERALFTWRVDQLRVPSAQVKDELKRWAAAFEKEHHRKPAPSEKSQSRASIREALRKRATPATKTHDLEWDLEKKRLQIWSASRKVVEEIVFALETGFEVKLVPLIPGALADELGVPEEALRPTAALVGAEFEEVRHG